MVLQEAGRNQGAEGIAGGSGEQGLRAERALAQPQHLAMAGAEAETQQGWVAAAGPVPR